MLRSSMEAVEVGDRPLHETASNDVDDLWKASGADSQADVLEQAKALTTLLYQKYVREPLQEERPRRLSSTASSNGVDEQSNKEFELRETLRKNTLLPEEEEEDEGTGLDVFDSTNAATEMEKTLQTLNAQMAQQLGAIENKTSTAIERTEKQVISLKEEEQAARERRMAPLPSTSKRSMPAAPERKGNSATAAMLEGVKTPVATPHARTSEANTRSTLAGFRKATTTTTTPQTTTTTTTTTTTSSKSSNDINRMSDDSNSHAGGGGGGGGARIIGDDFEEEDGDALERKTSRVTATTRRVSREQTSPYRRKKALPAVPGNNGSPTKGASRSPSHSPLKPPGATAATAADRKEDVSPTKLANVKLQLFGTDDDEIDGTRESVVDDEALLEDTTNNGSNKDSGISTGSGTGNYSDNDSFEEPAAENILPVTNIKSPLQQPPSPPMRTSEANLSTLEVVSSPSNTGNAQLVQHIPLGPIPGGALMSSTTPPPQPSPSPTGSPSKRGRTRSLFGGKKKKKNKQPALKASISTPFGFQHVAHMAAEDAIRVMSVIGAATTIQPQQQPQEQAPRRKNNAPPEQPISAWTTPHATNL